MKITEQKIKKLELEKKFSPQGGDCVSIAVALSEKFQTECIIFYKYKDDIRPSHAAILTENGIYDGTGLIKIDTERWSKTKLSNPYELKKNPLFNKERYLKIKEWISTTKTSTHTEI
jgi:hypothetical protein